MGCIYSICNKLNNSSYVGSAKDFIIRKRIHLRGLKNGNHHSILLQRAWNKYSETAFEFKIIEDNICVEDLIKREQWWIDNLKCEYNICRIAGSSFGIKRSNETRNKLSVLHTGRVHPEWRRKQKSLSQGGVNHWAFGKKMNEATKSKKSATMIEKYKSGYVHPRTRAIVKLSLCGEFIEEFVSTKVASGSNDDTAKAISNCLRGKSKSSLGFKWVYKDNFNLK